MQIDKIKRKATIVMINGPKRDVNFFLSQFSISHSGDETVLDVVSSQNSFIPLEDNTSGEIVFVNKDKIMIIELTKREHDPQIELNRAQVRVKMTNDENLEGEVFMDMPKSRSRVSDFFNIFHQFVCIYRDQGDLILNKDYILSVKER
ncbi:hypothetical protein ACFL0O_07665 [Thermodesulfobacteriota bacterium]